MDNVIQTPIIGEVEQSFVDYAMSVITDRALPSAEDGLKPVARRILYTMFEDGMASNKKFSKCAVPVSNTMGRYHPHGDASIYGTLIGLSQPWNMRYPLITFHGNNGSRDGDPPASYRYTECKLSPYAESALEDIKKDIVDWMPNYLEDANEPVYLPGKFPNLLCNGTSGIAVAMACSFAPHNFSEIMDAINYTLANPDCSVDDLLQFVTGPDFPTGGLVINKNELPEAYKTGKGRARIRGEYTIETKGNKTQIVFSSIPYKVSKESLIEVIDTLCEEKKLEGVTAIRDESNIKGVRFVIETNKDANVNTLIAKLFKLTNLEVTYSFNQVALINKQPKLQNLKQLIDIYIAHQEDILKRKSQHEFDKLNARIHIITGLLIALEDIDNIIQLIKESDSSSSAKFWLMSKYNLSEIQAKSILDMKLAKLAHLEHIELENEKTECVEKSKYHNSILTNPTFAKSELQKILIDFKAKFADDRRTTITQVDVKPEEKEIAFVEPEKCVVVLSEAGNIKRIPAASFKTQKTNTKGIKNQDDITAMTIRTNTIDSLMVFTNKGNMYRLLVDTIPIGTNVSKGQPIRSLIAMEPEEDAQTIYSIYHKTDAEYIFFVTKQGTIKKTSISEYVGTKKKTGIASIKLREGDSLAAVTLIKDEPVILLTKNGVGLKIESKDLSSASRVTIGVKGISLAQGDYIIAALPVRDEADCLGLFAESGLGMKFKVSDVQSQARGGKGMTYYKQGGLAAAALINDDDTVLISGDKTSVCVSAKEIPTLGRGSCGNKIIKNNNIISVTKI